MVAGLEILNKNGIYIPAKPIRGTFVVNVGDFLQRISNDAFVSTVHRVRNTSGSERYSIPFFFSFNMDVAVPVRNRGEPLQRALADERLSRSCQLAHQKKIQPNTNPEISTRYELPRWHIAGRTAES